MGEMKLIFNSDMNDSSIGDVFNRAKSVLNWQIDENFNAKLTDNDIDFQIKDISNLEKKTLKRLEIHFLIFHLTIQSMCPYKNTLLKIDINKDDSFNDLINEFKSSYENTFNYTKVDIDNYFDETVSYYSIHDFNGLNENIRIYK